MTSRYLVNLLVIFFTQGAFATDYFLSLQQWMDFNSGIKVNFGFSPGVGDVIYYGEPGDFRRVHIEGVHPAGEGLLRIDYGIVEGVSAETMNEKFKQEYKEGNAGSGEAVIVGSPQKSSSGSSPNSTENGPSVSGAAIQGGVSVVVTAIGAGIGKSAAKAQAAARAAHAKTEAAEAKFNDTVKELNAGVNQSTKAKNRLPESEMSRNDFDSDYEDWKFNKDISDINERFQNFSPKNQEQQDLKDFGQDMVHMAEKDYSNNKKSTAYTWKNLAQDALDIAIGIDPVTGAFRDTYEALTGVNLVTGEMLDAVDRAGAIVGMFSAGQGNVVKFAVKTKKLAELLEIINTVKKTHKYFNITKDTLDILKKLYQNGGLD